jgi:hypothetical protein
MNAARFLKIALPVIAIPALVILFLPESLWRTYVDIVEPLALLAGSALAMWVSFSYRKQLKAAFVWLSMFLLIYAAAIVLFLSFSPLLVPYLEPRIGTERIIFMVQLIQYIDYAALFLFCFYVQRVTNILQLNGKGWLLFVFTVIYAGTSAIYPLISQGVSTIRFSVITMRALDAILIIILVPVLWLYIQYLTTQRKQSFTFTLVIFGIVCSTIFDYLFQFITAIFPHLLPGGSSLYTTIPEVLFVYGYLLIAVGLYAHRKEDDWGYEAIERAMSSELKLADQG